MFLPTELWQYIIEDYNISTYGKCMRVDKMFHKIVKHIIKSIPKYIILNFNHDSDTNPICIENGLHGVHICKFINPNNINELWYDSRDLRKYTHNDVDISTRRKSIIVNRLDILFLRNIHWSISFVSISLPIKQILRLKPKIVNIKYTCHAAICFTFE